jgi:phosphoglycolate phosphatase
MQKRRIRNIIWDWNGTLLNDMVICIECMNTMLNKRSLPQLSSDHYREVFTFPVREYFLQIGFDFSTEDFEYRQSSLLISITASMKISACFLRPGAHSITSETRASISISFLHRKNRC